MSLGHKPLTTVSSLSLDGLRPRTSTRIDLQRRRIGRLWMAARTGIGSLTATSSHGIRPCQPTPQYLNPQGSSRRSVLRYATGIASVSTPTAQVGLSRSICTIAQFGRSAARSSIPSFPNADRIMRMGRAIPQLQSFAPKPRHALMQTSTFSSQSTSHSTLAHTERTANGNPTSATAQVAFYTALMRANMPKIIIERYETGQYATNANVDSMYLQALRQSGSVPQPSTGASTASVSSQGASAGARTLQAAGQTIAARLGASQPAPAATTQITGNGSKDSPLHVMFDESRGSKIFRWVRMLLSAGITAFICLAIASTVGELYFSAVSRRPQDKEVHAEKEKVRFSDIHGCDEAKDELQELVEFLVNPQRFSTLGGKLPKGVLLVGPPGTGKTILARAVAGEAGCPFFYMSGSEFDEMYVGIGAKRVRELFDQARAKSPSIIFIDELDAVGGKRNERDPAHAKQTLNQLLTELDGFTPSTGVILIAATNHPKALDKALTRPGRFDRRVTVNLPHVRGRCAILQHYLGKIAASPDVDPLVLARGTSGFSGADLENLVNQAAVRASRQKAKKVGPLDFEWAKDKIMMGAENRSLMVPEKDKIATAYHEAGHALVSLFTPDSADLHKMTIVPRGMALGVTHHLNELDAVSMDYQKYLARIDMAMGGRAAEEAIYGVERVSSGISSDLSQATNVAYQLVTQMGFSKKLGSLDLHTNYRDLSGQTKKEIEIEVRNIIEDARKRADTILKAKRSELELLKDALMEHETLDRDQIMKVINGEKLPQIKIETQSPPFPPREKNDQQDDDGGKKKGTEIGPRGGVGIKLPGLLIPATPPPQPPPPGPRRTGDDGDQN